MAPQTTDEPTAINHLALDSLIFANEFPFATQANRTGRFNYMSNDSWRNRDFERIAQLSERFGIDTIDDLRYDFRKSTAWSGAYFEALATRSGYWRWDSDRTLLFLLVLIAIHSAELTVADLVNLGWEELFASKVLNIAQSIAASRRLH